MCRYKSEGDPNGLSDCDSLRRENDMNHDLIRKLREEIRVLREERRWIPVGERLPPDDSLVDVAGPRGDSVGWYEWREFHFADEVFKGPVTHWRKRGPGPEGVS